MKKGRKILACLILMVLVLSQVPTNLLVRAEEGEETKYNLSFELERDASALNEIYQKHDEAEDQSEKTDEKASDEEADGELDANKDNETVVDLSQETEEEKAEENSSEEAKPVDEAKPIDEAKPVDEGLAGDESNQADEDEAIVLPSGGGEGSSEEKAEEAKDLNITYTLHIKGADKDDTIEKRITYSVEKADFVGDLKFEGIETLSNELEVKYYSKEDGSSFDEKSENFDLYLETNSEKTVLELPSIGEREDSLRVKESNFEEVIEIGEEKVNEAVGDPNATVIYLNGQAVDDTKDGSTEENAVQTFERAKELAAANQNIEKIIVTGKTDIEGDISLTGTNAKVYRSIDYNGYLFNVANGNTATLSNITIDGNTQKISNIEKSLIYVGNGATLNINDGAILKNNKIKAIENTATEGGAVHAESANVNMTGGSVEDNQATYGGGIYLYGSTMNFSGGVVQNNKSKQVIDYAHSEQVYSAGGGIIANGGSTINMSSEAEVLNNIAAEIGGGISLGSNQWGPTNILNMTGGTIGHNEAGAAGGGIFVQGKYSNGGASKAIISAGNIINNIMNGTGRTNKSFGGGGIYVNGFNRRYGGNGVLELKNAIITANMSLYSGAGYASCPVSETTIYVNDGVALYGNVSEQNDDLFIYCDTTFGIHAGNPKYMLSRRMLGGTLNNWINVVDNKAFPENNYEKEITINKDKSYLYIFNNNNDVSEFTNRLAKVFITGNKSFTAGAGIGSNGTVIFGTDNETKEVKVKKAWNDDNNKDNKRPKSIKVTLMAKIGGESTEYEVETVELNEENQWSYEFKGLPSKSGDTKITYTVKEESIDGYKSVLSGSEKDGYTITNTPEKPKKRNQSK